MEQYQPDSTMVFPAGTPAAHALIYILIYELQRDKEKNKTTHTDLRITECTIGKSTLMWLVGQMHRVCIRSQLFPVASFSLISTDGSPRWLSGPVPRPQRECVLGGYIQLLSLLASVWYLRTLRRPIKFVTVCRESRRYDSIGRRRILLHRARNNYIRGKRSERGEEGWTENGNGMANIMLYCGHEYCEHDLRHKKCTQLN